MPMTCHLNGKMNGRQGILRFLINVFFKIGYFNFAEHSFVDGGLGK